MGINAGAFLEYYFCGYIGESPEWDALWFWPCRNFYTFLGMLQFPTLHRRFFEE
jgi:hypothetical protein